MIEAIQYVTDDSGDKAVVFMQENANDQYTATDVAYLLEQNGYQTEIATWNRTGVIVPEAKVGSLDEILRANFEFTRAAPNTSAYMPQPQPMPQEEQLYNK